MVIQMKKRRKRRVYHDWSKEIAEGKINQFYNSTDFDIAREKVLARDKYTCQFFLGKWNDGIHKPNKIKIVKANVVHHIIPIKERPDLALDINNMVSLSFEAHEIIEDRNKWKFLKTRKNLTKEKW